MATELQVFGERMHMKTFYFLRGGKLFLYNRRMHIENYLFIVFQMVVIELMIFV